MGGAVEGRREARAGKEEEEKRNGGEEGGKEGQEKRGSRKKSRFASEEAVAPAAAADAAAIVMAKAQELSLRIKANQAGGAPATLPPSVPPSLPPSLSTPAQPSVLPSPPAAGSGAPAIQQAAALQEQIRKQMEGMQASLAVAKARAAAAALQQQPPPPGGKQAEEKKPRFQPMRFDAQGREVDEEGNLIKTDLSGIRTVKANIPGGKKVTRESGREGGRGRRDLEVVEPKSDLKSGTGLGGKKGGSAGKDEEGKNVLPTYLTKKERKRLRRQARKEREQEKRDKIALGLMPPPEPKMNLSNFMKVLANESIADPSAVTAKIQAQIREREKNHEMRNLARKLTPEERREKKRRKIINDMKKQIEVALFRVRQLHSPKIRYKIDVNAQQSGLSGGEGGRKGGKAGRREGRREGKRTTMLPGGAQTDDECPLLDSSPLPLPPLVTSPPVGAVLTCRDPAFGEEGMHLVVVEGGPRSVRRFVKLMTRRIKWRAQQEGGGGQEGEGEEEEEEEEEEEGRGGGPWGKGGGNL
ncbi:hypothetical protein NSK_001784 [Nannochloropsis salina CCMP1776]|uniref:Pre-mRNA-splicing factor 3 domain-containing protein n=1 Tax=Nannochloropsis salina CCMP1776 TaxID=1027361 RepID=A0A4D9D5P3_9STRA|nr:hypothetical protein NSK_001784 [Nannochloropsis salina CCMP1776]|eukprot:TFJ86696.1 hypothetical protein NSK_001784 [Nannochloropsis salina CCMP1776]